MFCSLIYARNQKNFVMLGHVSVWIDWRALIVWPMFLHLEVHARELNPLVSLPRTKWISNSWGNFGF